MSQSTNPSRWRHLNSYFKEQLVETSKSDTNPYLEVAFVNGHHELNATRANYSFGSLHRVFEEVFREFNVRGRKPKHALILGLGAGSCAQLLTRFQIPFLKIVGVEADAEVLRLADKYFNINTIPNLEIFLTDAVEFAAQTLKRFDLVVVDLFIDNLVPAKAETPGFLQNLQRILTADGMLIFNRMTDTPENRTTTKHFEVLYGVVFPSYTVYKMSENWIFVQDNASGVNNSIRASGYAA